MAYENIIISDSGYHRVVMINRPKVLNALNRKTLLELEKVFHEIEDNKKIRTVIVTGAGEKSFVAGADIGEMKNISAVEAEQLSKLGHRVFDTISSCRVPVIAAVNGYALGGGLELALACDFIYASENAVFGLVEAKLGLIPGFGGVGRLLRRVGDAMAREMIYGALQINAHEALRIGLINRVILEGQLMDSAAGCAEKMSQRAPYAVSLCKSLLDKAHDIHLDAANVMEQRSFAMTFSTKDRVEGIEAFLEKREPNFEGV